MEHFKKEISELMNKIEMSDSIHMVEMHGNKILEHLVELSKIAEDKSMVKTTTDAFFHTMNKEVGYAKYHYDLMRKRNAAKVREKEYNEELYKAKRQLKHDLFSVLNSPVQHRRRCIHPSPNFSGCGFNIDATEVNRIKIIGITETIKPVDIYINMSFKDSLNKPSDTLPIKYEDLAANFINGDKEFLLYKHQSSAWSCLGVMVDGKFVALDPANANIPAVQNVQPFDFYISYELIF